MRRSSESAQVAPGKQKNLKLSFFFFSSYYYSIFYFFFLVSTIKLILSLRVVD